tara:strand:- start:403 stop:525 length:123 start_codon:yes stop_codon:yes gene_type:complete
MKSSKKILEKIEFNIDNITSFSSKPTTNFIMHVQQTLNGF